MISPLARPIIQSPILSAAPFPAIAPDYHHNNTQAVSEFAEYILPRHIPRAQDGFPLWNNGIFSESPDAAPGDDRPLQRERRASLRPQYELLSGYTPIGNTNVGKALREYGRILWNIRQKTAPRLGLALKIRQQGIDALGGPGTKRAQEFLRRCKITSRFTIHLNKLQNNALAYFPRMHAHFVREEVEKLRITASYSLSNGQAFEGATPAKLQRAVECRVQRSESNWLTFPVYWVWSKLWC